jgi:hypothetical protein
MKARSFFVGIVAAVLVMTLANVSWADWGRRGWYSPPPAPPAPHGWYGHPYYHPGYRPYYALRPLYPPPPGAVYVSAPRAVYAPVPGPGYGGGFISTGIGISLPGVGFSLSFHIP